MSAQNPRPLPPEVIAALQQGNLIQAIKLLRKTGNIDLRQAKDAIEQHLDRSKLTKATLSEVVGSINQVPGVADALRKGNKIEAVRILREKTGLRLKDAKDAIDRFPGQTMEEAERKAHEPIRQQLSRPGLAPGEVPDSEGGGRWWLIIAIIVGALIYYVLYRLG